MPDEVRTKFGKKIITYFFPVGELFLKVFTDWVNFLKDEMQFDYDAPLFPKTKLGHNQEQYFEAECLDDCAWQSTTAIREIVKEAFKLAGLSYYNPHSFRDTLVRFAYERCKTPKDIKAFSQNIGHSNLLTTLTSYGEIDAYNQGEIIKRLGKEHADDVTLSDLKELILKQNGA